MKASILKLIGRSPVRGLRKHLKLTEEMSKMLDPFFRAIFEKDYIVAASVFDEMINVKRQADKRKEMVRRLMNKPLMLAFPRGEILYILNAQEKILNVLHKSVVVLVCRKVGIPKEVKPIFFEFLKCVERCIEKLNKTILELDDLVETGFGHVFREHVLKVASDLSRLQHRVDDQEIVLRETLYLVESTLNPVDVVFIYQSIERLSRIGNITEEIGGRLIMLIEN